MARTQDRLGILVGGGPAPGINSAISAAAIEAANSGLEVLGIYDGYKWLMQGRTEGARPMTISDVSFIHSRGGSVLRTSRSNPTSSAESLQNTVRALRSASVS
jgi:6-phosphofructokinase 1